jgi:hypothetical protein
VGDVIGQAGNPRGKGRPGDGKFLKRGSPLFQT